MRPKFCCNCLYIVKELITCCKLGETIEVDGREEIVPSDKCPLVKIDKLVEAIIAYKEASRMQREKHDKLKELRNSYTHTDLYYAEHTAATDNWHDACDTKNKARAKLWKLVEEGKTNDN